MREIPLSVQLPDWNNWLPDIHPHDGMEKIFDGSTVEQMFDDAQGDFTTYAETQNYAAVRNFVDGIMGPAENELRDPIERTKNPSPFTDTPLTTNQWMHSITSINQWMAVKGWYLQHAFNLEDKIDELECDGSNKEWCEPLGWYGEMRLVFNIAPHVSGTELKSAPYVYGSEDANYFFTHTWYQLQMVLNPGTNGSQGIRPVDEGYQEAFLRDTCNRYDVACGLRQTFSEWKFWQCSF